MRLVGAELLKIRTTSTWWIFTIVLVPLWALAVGYNWLQAYATGQVSSADVPSDQAALVEATNQAINVATNLYTSGQFFGVLLAMLLGAILVTNEFFHLTATTTFLTTPHRERVILAKLGAAVLASMLFWLVTTLLNLAVAPLVRRQLDLPVQLGEPAVWRAIGHRVARQSTAMGRGRGHDRIRGDHRGHRHFDHEAPRHQLGVPWARPP